MKVKLRIKVDEVQAHQQLLSKALLACSAGSQSGHEPESPTPSSRALAQMMNLLP